MIHVLHLVLAVGTSAILVGGTFVLESGAGARMRAGVSGRARVIVLPRQRSWFLSPRVQGLAHLVVGDVQGPAGAGLYLARVQRTGLPGLRWKLLHAGFGHRSVAWLRLQQAEMVAAVFIGGLALLSALDALQPTVLALLLAVALAVGYVLPLARLEHRAMARRERLRVELVGFLYGLAAFVAAGRPLDRALDRLAQRPGELAYELFKARELYFQGLDMAEALGVLVARCDTEEVRDAMSLVLAARSDDVDKTRIPRMLAALADTTRMGLRERRKVRLAYALVRTTALGTLLGLPVIGTALLYPVVVHTLHTLL